MGHQTDAVMDGGQFVVGSEGRIEFDHPAIDQAQVRTPQH